MRQRIKNLVEKLPLGYTVLKGWRKTKIALESNFEINMSQVHEVKTLPYNISQLNISKDNFYSSFENVFRGSESVISKRQAVYLKYIQISSEGGRCFLDIGCGRGEFLKLLIDENISVKGIELNKMEYNRLSSKGFNIELTDANTYLEKAEEGSLLGISAFQVIEHLAFDYLDRLLSLAYKKIYNNGVIILETVNPKCTMALSNFYIDPTHLRPYSLELIKFMLEWHGFKDIVAVFSSPCPKELWVRDNIQNNYMDYALIGWKR